MYVNKSTDRVSVSITLSSHTGQSCIILLYLCLDYLNVLLGDSLLKIIAAIADTVPTLIM